MATSACASALQLAGAGGFGVLLGWQAYFVNRYRRAEVQITDLVTLVAVLGGGGVLAVFPAGTDLFGAYGIGLCLGFFGYLVTLLLMVKQSKQFGLEWFLDGRRQRPADDEITDGARPTAAPMEREQLRGRREQ